MAEPDRWIWVCDGTSDQIEINSAITTVAAYGGGRVQLVGTGFNLSDRISQRTGVHLTGDGLGTSLKAVGDFQKGMIELYDSTAHGCKVSNLTLDGDDRSVHGIYWLLDSGQVFTSAPSTNPDSANSVDNVFINDVGSTTFAGYGLATRGSNLRAGKYTNIRIQNSSGCNVWIDGPDSHYNNVEVGSAGSKGLAFSTSATAPVGFGFYVGGDNNMIVNCKAWYSRGDGFYAHGTRNSFANCQAQDNYGNGFYGYYGKNSYVGCQADSNGQGLGSATYGSGNSGFKMTSGSNVLSGCIAFDRGGQSWVQQYGFTISSGFSNSRIVGCATYGNAVSSQTGTLSATSTVDIVADANGK